MPVPILGNAAGFNFTPKIDLIRAIPAGYVQFFGYPNVGTTKMAEVFAWLAGGTATNVNYGLFNSHVVGGNLVPHELLGTGASPELGGVNHVPLLTEGGEGTTTGLPEWQFPILRGPEGAPGPVTWPPGSEPHESALTGPPQYPGNVLEDRFKYVFKNGLGEVVQEGFYRIKVKRLTRPNDDLGNIWCPISDAPLPFGNGEYNTTANNLGGSEEGGVSHFNVTISEITEAPPLSAVAVEVFIQGGRLFWYTGEGEKQNEGAGVSLGVQGFYAGPVKLAAHESRGMAALPGPPQAFFLAVEPVGGDLILPFTKDGAARDRHKAGAGLVDDPAVVVGGEGGAGEYAPVAFALGKPPALEQLI